MKEQQPRSLPELGIQAERFSSALSRVDNTARALGTSLGPPKLNFETSLGTDHIASEERIKRIEKVGLIREAIATRTVPLLERKKAEFDRQIESFALIDAQQRVSRISKYVEEGYLSKLDLEAAERELEALRGKLVPFAPPEPSQEEPSVEISPTPEAQKPYNLPDGQEVPLVGMQRRLADMLPTEIDKAVATSSLAEVLYEAELREGEISLDIARPRVIATIAVLKKAFNPLGYDIINTVGRKRNTVGGYYITQKPRDVEEAASTEQVQEDIATIQRLADKGILVDQEQLKRAKEDATKFGGIIALREPEQPEKGKPFSLPDGQEIADLTSKEIEILGVLKTIYTRNELEEISAEEIIKKIWGEDTNVSVGLGRLNTNLGDTRRKLDPIGWRIINSVPRGSKKRGSYRLEKVAGEKAQKESETVPEQPRLNPEQAVILIGLIRHKAASRIPIEGVDYQFRIDPQTDEVFEHILDQYAPVRQEHQADGELDRLRGEALGTVEKIIKDPNKNQIIQSHEPEIELLLDFFLSPDQPEMERFLIPFLRAEDPDVIIKEVKRFVEEVQRKPWRPQRARVQFERMVTKEASDVEVEVRVERQEEESESSEPVTTQIEKGIEVEIEPPVQALPVEPAQPRLTEQQIARQTMVTERVSAIVSDVTRVPSLSEQIGGAQLTYLIKQHLCVTISQTDQEKAEERGFIQPTKADSDHRVYGPTDTIALIYIKRYGNNVSKPQRRELLKIIDREFQKSKEGGESQ